MDVLHGDRLPRQHAGAPAEARRQRDLGVALLQQRRADQIVEGAGEVAAPVEERVGAADLALEFGGERRARLCHRSGHLGVGRDHIGEQRDQLVAEALDRPALHVEIEPRDELAVAAGRDQQRVADLHRFRQRVVGVAGQDHVDAVDPRGELAVDVEAVVRQEHDELRAFLAHLLDIGAHVVLANAERPVRHHPARIGDRRIRERLAEHGDLHAAALEHLVRLEHRLLPVVVADIECEERKVLRLDQLLHPVFAIGEFPVAGHRVGLQELHAVGHVLALGLQRAERTLPGVAAIEQQHAVAAALRPHRLDDRRGTVETADAAIGLRQRLEVLEGQRIGVRRFFRNAVALQERLAGDVRRLALGVADPEIERRLAEIERRQLAVDVGDVQQRHVADRLEFQKIGLRQPLLRETARAGEWQNGSRRRRELKQIAPRKHSAPIKRKRRASGAPCWR